MLIDPPLERLLPKAENRYILTMLAAKRARQLTMGGNPMVDSVTPNFVSLASEELDQDRVVYRKGKHEPFVPLRPEIEAARLAAELEAREKREFEFLEETRRGDPAEFSVQRIFQSLEGDVFGPALEAEDIIQQFVKIVDEDDALQEQEDEE